MRIGIDATGWANSRGYGRFTREVTRALAALEPAHELICFLDRRSADTFSLTRANVQAIIVSQSVPPTIAAAAGSRRSITDMLRLTRAVRRVPLDVFFFPSVYTYFPLPRRVPAVVTIHDAIPERFPQWTLPSWRDRFAWRLKTRVALTQTRLVLTVSDYAAREIARHLGVKPERIRVALESAGEEYRPSEDEADVRSAADRLGLPAYARWLLYVGGFGPHKQVDRLARAHAEVAKRHPDSPPFLVLVGSEADGFHQDVGTIRRTIRACGTEPLVRWAGFVPDAELRHLQSGAVALVLPSASEGFGLPAIEAARCGTPVVATTESPLPRLLEGGGIFVPPDDEPALADAIERLLSDEEGRRAMGCRALEQASTFSWSRTAQSVLSALEEAVRPRV